MVSRERHQRGGEETSKTTLTISVFGTGPDCPAVYALIIQCKSILSYGYGTYKFTGQFIQTFGVGTRANNLNV